MIEGFVGNGERQRMLYNYWRREGGRYEQGKRERTFSTFCSLVGKVHGASAGKRRRGGGVDAKTRNEREA